MWDDSYDSIPSPDIPKGKSNVKSSLSDVPSGFGNKKGSGGYQKSDQRDIDLLFSPENSAPPSAVNSPDEKFVGGEKRKYIDPYAFTEPSKPENYLSNFATNSGDLEDSILGELLGGGPKKSSVPPPSASTKTEKGGRKLSPAGKLDPIDANFVKSPKATNSPVIPHKSTKDPFAKQPISRFSNEGPLNSIRSANFEDSVGTGGPTTGGGRAHFNSFDVGESVDEEDNNNSNKNEYLPSKPSAYLPTKVDASLTNKRNFSLPAKSEYSNTGIASTASTEDKEATDTPPLLATLGRSNSRAGGPTPSLASGSEHDKKDEEGETGFIPSFLDPNRQGRRRRIMEDGPRPGSASSGGGGVSSGLSKLDALDAALGLASAPTTGTNKKPVIDPFATAEKKLSSLPSANLKNTILADSDSSSDDDLLRPKTRSTSTSSKFGSKSDTSPPIINKPGGAVPALVSSMDLKKDSTKETTTSTVNIPPAVATNTVTSSTNNTTSTSSAASLKNLPAVNTNTTTSSSSTVVKLPSPDHKSNAIFTMKLSNKSRDDQQEPKRSPHRYGGLMNDEDLSDPEEEDELDISGIVKANDDELARFGFKETSARERSSRPSSSDKKRESELSTTTSNNKDTGNTTVAEKDKDLLNQGSNSVGSLSVIFVPRSLPPLLKPVLLRQLPIN